MDPSRDLLDCVHTAIAVVDADGNLVEHNDAYRRAAGALSRTDLAGAAREALALDTDVTLYTVARGADGDTWFDVTAAPLPDHRRVVIEARDVTDLVTEVRARRARGLQDAITGALSADGLADALLADAHDHASTAQCVVLLDVDQFSVIRQTLGYAAGDALLRAVVHRLQRHVPADGHLARLEGDTFCLICTPRSPADVDTLVSELRDAVRQPLDLHGRHVRITASVGAALSEPGSPAEAAMQHAELAMQEASRRGGNRCVTYTPALAEPQEGMVRLWNALRDALQFRQMEVWFQPVVSLVTDRPVAAEALCRWHHPQFGDIAPGVFIPIAERNSEILHIGSFVHGRAAEMMNALKASRRDVQSGFQITFNASPNELAWPEFGRNVLSRLRANDTRPEWFAVEVIEDALRQRDGAVFDNLQLLREAGMTVALDDFGAGYSSLDRLRDLPVDRVKIDRRFVAELMHSERNERLIAAIIALADELGIDTVAEGVETAEQAARLRALGCHAAQGFLFAPAVPDSELLTVLRDLAGAASAAAW